MSIERYLEAQERSYFIALDEIKNGKKQSHWMWYIFPQIEGLGHSSTSRYYAIKNIEEAIEYLNHKILGTRLVEICNELLKLDNNNAHDIFGSPDDKKLHSSITLFFQIKDANPVFISVMEKFFDCRPDMRTLRILNRQATHSQHATSSLPKAGQSSEETDYLI